LFVRVTQPDLADPPALVRPGRLRFFAWRRSSAAIDAGALLPNINDRFTGGAPDLGALEAISRSRTTAQGDSMSARKATTLIAAKFGSRHFGTKPLSQGGGAADGQGQAFGVVRRRGQRRRSDVRQRAPRAQ